jgi:uncharacterized protein (DUF2147 family)
MKTKLWALAAAGIFAASTAMADEIEGVWQTEPDDGAFAMVEIAPCGDAYCGHIRRTFNSDGEYQSENIGKMLVIDMVPVGDGAYEGQVWRPSNDKIYIGKINIDGSEMKLRGCVAGGLLCSSQRWVKLGG